MKFDIMQAGFDETCFIETLIINREHLPDRLNDRQIQTCSVGVVAFVVGAVPNASLL